MTGDGWPVVWGTLTTTASWSGGMVLGCMVGSGAAADGYAHGRGISADGTLLAGYGLPLLLGSRGTLLPSGVGIVESAMLPPRPGSARPTQLPQRSC